MDAKQLVGAAMKKTGLDSTRTLAKRLGVSHVAVAKWINGENCPTFEQAAELANIAELPIVQTAAEVRMSSPDTKAKHGNVLRLITQGASLCLAAYLFSHLDVQSSSALAVAPFIHYAK